MVLSLPSISSRPRTGWIIRARPPLQKEFFLNFPATISCNKVCTITAHDSFTHFITTDPTPRK